MKQFLFSVLALTFSVVAFAQKKSADVAKFASETIDLGKIQQGNPTAAVFSVTNIGTEPLIIETASPTCGCTISDYTKEPIAAGKEGSIKATYNAANIGHFEKHLTVKFAGTDDVRSITIKGDVLSKEDYAKLKPAETQKETTPAKEIKSNKTKTKAAAKS